MSGKYYTYIPKPNTTQDVFVITPLIYFWYVVWQEDAPTSRHDGSALLDGDTWFDLTAGTIKIYKSSNWQKAGLIGNSEGGFAPGNVEFRILDENPNPATQTGLLSFYGGSTPNRIFVIQAQGGDLQIRKANDQIVTTFLANGDVKIWNNLEVVGDIILDDITTDVITLKDRIQHDGNTTNYIGFDVDKMTLDASGTSIILDDTSMTNQIVVTGSTQFVNNIEDIPDIYLRNHVHHYSDLDTRMGFPANDQIALRTGGTDRVLVTDTETTIQPSLTILNTGGQPMLRALMGGTGITEDQRFALQTTQVNGNSRFYVKPNGTGTIAAIQFSNNSDLVAANQQRADVGMVGGEFRFSASQSGTDAMPAFNWRTGANVKMRLGDVSTGSTGQEVLSVGQDVSGVYATGNPYKGVLLNQLHTLGWADITAGYTTGSYCNMFRRTNTASLMLCHGYRRDDTSGLYLESSTSNATGRGAVEVGPAYVQYWMNDSSTTPIGTQITPNKVFTATPGQQLYSSYDQTIKHVSIISGRKTNNGNNVAVPILQMSKGGDTGGSSYSTFTGIINFSGYMRTSAAVVAVTNYTAKIHIYLTAGNSIAVNIQDVSTTFSSNNAGQLIQTGVNFSGTGNTNTAYTLNFAIPYTITVGTVTESGFTLSLDGHQQALTEGEMITFTNL